MYKGGYGYIKGERVITLEMQAYNGLKQPRDTIKLYGEPSMYACI